ncbi:DUF5060 domain-containing protein [Porifericola rhodea]|uniref:DUF5060 domain-containing protein n=1 Tax=Porifericola rhodea TaxID=930972 RepID=UPI00266545BD|nr:DUF5060 domain-containing protein [Porifericola rhodea]WKN32772.1 DUF5060 domain-containing protein [Porifericola rhodea]
MNNLQTTFLPLFLSVLLVFGACQSDTEGREKLPVYKKWHKMTLNFEGPQTSESANDNPFLNYRLEVTFQHEDRSYTIPGYYAADGNAAESSADSGNIWQVNFSPDEAGIWQYKVSFRKGDSIAVSDDSAAGEALAFDGEEGRFEVVPSDKNGKDLRAQGRLKYIGERYLRFAESQKYFLKGGTDSPENLLGFEDFDGTYFGADEEQREGEAAADKNLHRYMPHVEDWKEGDPSWGEGKGKGLIGALNYLAEKEMNSIYFLTMNIGGDGKDVWPYTSYEERFRFDCSKLAQWEKVFSHADSLGIMLHFVLQETENELLLDGGETGPERKLYYRELIARFAHHLAITWNMGEENGYANFTPEAQNDAQRKDMIAYIKQTDPYNNFLAIHTHASRKYRYQVLDSLLGFQSLDGPSLQINPPSDVHSETKHWIDSSAVAGKQWVVNLDEIGPHYHGVLPDNIDPEHDTVRYEVLWGNLMAGGGGVEWYFGYRFPNDDLNAETFRTRNNVWEQTAHALRFFNDYLPFWNMHGADELLDSDRAYCFAEPGVIYAVYLPKGEKTQLDLGKTEKNYTIKWYNPKSGGELQEGSKTEVSGPGKVTLGTPPAAENEDWVALVKLVE